MSARRLPIFILAPLIALTACRESKVTAYRIPKEKETELPAGHPPAGTMMPGADTTAGARPGAGADSTAGTGMAGAGANMGNSAAGNGGLGAAAPGMADTSVPTVTENALTWKAPGDWTAQPASPMRKASYTIAGTEGKADLSITAFPGDVGGELANINRWRGQVGYAPLAAADLDQSVDRSEINGLHVTVVNLTDAQKPKGTLGALVPYQGGVWFFKLTGPTALVARQKAAFLAFLKTIKPSTP